MRILAGLGFFVGARTLRFVVGGAGCFFVNANELLDLLQGLQKDVRDLFYLY